MGAIAIVASAANIGGIASSVEKKVQGLVSSVVGFVDPGKARDETRENRAELWYQWAKEGSLYAARHLWGGFNPPTEQYTVKEKGYYQTRFNELKASNPTLANQAVAAGPLPLPGDATLKPTQNDIDAVTADLTALASAPFSPYGATPAPAVVGPLAGTPAAQPIVPAAVGQSGNPALAAAAQAQAPQASGKTLLLIGGFLIAALAVVGIMGSRKK